ncbi:MULTISPECIES: helix-turn-helix domain-containing protein [Dyella]|uniref:AraC family transcriptional regulator n=2 Tax=Dyella TaxID=231454 RepID=A0A4R0YVV8_9GAMM|nr:MULTISPECIES: AraC family transcriptional regulator [Dyella]TBR39780.1 AraC family transcriptional regulator [Dyella terrae]TCI12641.1 AraC family transcriptional regulator [Dyella soli]
MSIMQTVLQTPHFIVINHVCQFPRVDCGYVQGDQPARIIFTRRGSFALHVKGKTRLARPGQAVMIDKHMEYHVTHPDTDGCDCCTDIWMDDATRDALREEGLASEASRALPHDLQFQRLHVELLQGIRKESGATSDAEDALYDALACLLQVSSQSSVEMRQVSRAEEAIVGHADENVDIATLARLVGCSPFHLCRVFRAATGQSLRQFRLQQRLGAAVGRLGDGEDDLAAMACDLGFSSHSHMTDAFRRFLGLAPAQLREQLRQSDLRHWRERLQAYPLRLASWTGPPAQ